MFFLLLILHVLAALVLILVVMLQSGKAGDLASAFGGTSSQTAFGVRSAATLLTKVTAGAAVIFMVTALGLSIYSSSSGEGSIMENTPGAQTTPATTAPPPAAPAGEQTPAPAESAPAPAQPPTSGEGTGQK